eukprot:3181811-Rhodomonas_salina.1
MREKPCEADAIRSTPDTNPADTAQADAGQLRATETKSPAVALIGVPVTVQKRYPRSETASQSHSMATSRTRHVQCERKRC